MVPLNHKAIIMLVYGLLLLFFTPSTFALAEKIIDLTHDFNHETLYMPAAKPFELHKIFAGITPSKFYYAENDFSTDEHVGTHMDAPNHFAKNHFDIASVPLNKLMGAAIKIDLSEKTLTKRDYLITIQDLQDWEKKHGNIPDHTIILLDTGYSQYWPNRTKYLGTSTLGAKGVSELNFPGLSPEAAKWLVKTKKIKAIGIDTASIDYGHSKDFPSHQIFANNNIPIFENLDHLHVLPPKGFKIYALPMKISQGTGAPLRIVAITHS